MKFICVVNSRDPVLNKYITLYAYNIHHILNRYICIYHSQVCLSYILAVFAYTHTYIHMYNKNRAWDSKMFVWDMGRWAVFLCSNSSISSIYTSRCMFTMLLHNNFSLCGYRTADGCAAQHFSAIYGYGYTSSAWVWDLNHARVYCYTYLSVPATAAVEHFVIADPFSNVSIEKKCRERMTIKTFIGLLALHAFLHR